MKRIAIQGELGSFHDITAHEYFQLCADLNALALPIVNVGLSCQPRAAYVDGCRCDYTICGNKDPYLKEHPEYRDEKGYRRNK